MPDFTDERQEEEYYKCIVGLIKKGKSKGQAVAICKSVVLKDKVPGKSKKKLPEK